MKHIGSMNSRVKHVKFFISLKWRSLNVLLTLLDILVGFRRKYLLICYLYANELLNNSL